MAQEAACDALRDVLRRLAGPAAPAVVLSTRPAGQQEAQVSSGRGLGRGGQRGCAGLLPVGSAGPSVPTAARTLA